MDMPTPWLPDGHTLTVPNRGELFYRRCVHPDAAAPTVLLLHGWTASADTQFFTAYRALADRYSLIAIDHRGHGRGLRAPFTLEDAADDAVALVRALGLNSVIALGYSMGGPIALLSARRHPDVVAGIVAQATALEWQSSWRDRISWRGLAFGNSVLRTRAFAWVVERALDRVAAESAVFEKWERWVLHEALRNDPAGLVQAGQALARYDARPWAATLGKPAGMLVTTRDRVVPPVKQRVMASALHATVRELAADHFCSWTHIDEYVRFTIELIDDVVTRAA